jgi:hypothetical protein
MSCESIQTTLRGIWSEPCYFEAIKIYNETVRPLMLPMGWREIAYMFVILFVVLDEVKQSGVFSTTAEVLGLRVNPGLGKLGTFWLSKGDSKGPPEGTVEIARAG